ncbi:MAG: carbohydrate ABC transporter substrate-binding protein [Actinomycetales bacterium]|nr:carbohydrate ABC transporter substrate-binding protein [Actinomycetales bacterium]
MRTRLSAVAALAITVGMLAACGSDDEQPDQGATGSEVSGSITVLTQRTDIVDSVFKKQYLPRFNQKYPGVTVKFEAITDYEGEVRIRMNTKDYGDVLLIPNSVTADQLPTFFEPLGTLDELRPKYRFTTEQAYQGKVYGIAITGNAQGILYNKKVFQQAGVTEMPKTPDEFLAALKLVKEKTSAIPLYTNYAAGWPLTQWEGMRGGITNDPEAVNKLAHLDAPWAPGAEHFTIDSLLYNVVKQGLVEKDPTTTDWEQSKSMLAKGEIATMVLGSWAIIQMQEKATDKADIGYMPIPVAVGGTYYSVTGGDYKNAININSKNKAAARAWLDWFANESNYAFDQGGLPPLKSGRMPQQLVDFQKLGVEFMELNPAPSGEEGLVQRIDAEAEIGLWEPKYRQRIVDAARGAGKETLEQIFADLNARWAKARAETT